MNILEDLQNNTLNVVLFFINIANSKLHFAGNFTSLLEHPISGIFPENYYSISELKGLDRVSRLSDYLTG